MRKGKTGRPCRPAAAAMAADAVHKGNESTEEAIAGSSSWPNCSGMKLCGFALAVLSPRRWGGDDMEHDGLEVEVGSACHLVGQGSDTVAQVQNTNIALVPVTLQLVNNVGTRGEDDCDGQIKCRETVGTANGTGIADKEALRSPDRYFPDGCVSSDMMESTPVTERVAPGNLSRESRRSTFSKSGGRKCIKTGAAGTSSARKPPRSGVSGLKVSGILQQLQLLEQKNNAVVVGRVVRMTRMAVGMVRYVALLDVYVPASLWTSTRNFWKSGSLVASGISHMSCDWDHRSSILRSMQAKESASHSFEEFSVWNVGDCHVYGCKLHYQLSEQSKSVRFDLHSLFKALPTYDRDEKPLSSSITPNNVVNEVNSGIWSMPDDVMTNILGKLLPRDLQSVAAVCRHTRTLAVLVMPCMNLKLFAHQQAAVRWMLQRELNVETTAHPYIRDMQTDDGFHFYVDCVSGDFSTESPPPLKDFRGGLFCDEPGLGKTVTALSLILKTQGTLAQPPAGVSVRWCEHNSDQKYGYYEISTRSAPHGVFGVSAMKRCSTLKSRRYQFESTDLSPLESPSPSRKRSRGPKIAGSNSPSSSNNDRSIGSSSERNELPAASRVTALRTSFRVKRKLWEAHGGDEDDAIVSDVLKDTRICLESARVSGDPNWVERDDSKLCRTSSPCIDRYAFLYGGTVGSIQNGQVKQEAQKRRKDADEIWVQCDACTKWRKLPDEMGQPKEGLAWFCSMNKDPLRQECSVPEETFDTNETITSMPGFTRIGKAGSQELNVSFFRNVLKEHAHCFDVEAKRAVSWLAALSSEKLSKVTVAGFTMPPGLRLASVSGHDHHQYDKLFQAFGLIKRKEAKKVTRWCYPKGLSNLFFDSKALKAALSNPVDDVTRFYLSKATLVVVPQNLIEHWRQQIKKHITSSQLRVFIWNDVRKPPAAHSLAWDYDIVITTFSRLSVEWSSRESSALVRIHWLRIMLDEGHTLGASLSLTNKLQMAISMQASRRWLLTGTPTPNTPSSQVAHLQPMLKFLHEEAYGNHQKAWEGAILRPFEAGREEGRERLIHLLHRCMISARKSDLHTIPPCIRKVKLLDFTEQHAASYNELVVTVKRNILMADWKDPSHVESLLNPKQWKFRTTTIRNVRLSCCVAGHIKVRNAGEDIQETMDMLVEQGMGPSSEEFIMIKSALIHGGACHRCCCWCRLPIVTPCHHLLCLSCVSIDCEKCTMVGCGQPYKMQSPKNRARPENPNPKWPVPQDLIELQPSYAQDNWDPDWHATSSSKVAYLVGQLKELQARNEKKMQMFAVDILGDQEYLQPGREMSSESLWEPQDFVQLTRTIQPEKAIVFSQFLEHINVVEKQLAAAGLRSVSMYSPMHSANKMKSLMTFQKDSECTILVMDGSAALGLDLSFVTHVYLMEPIWDRSMEEQVVSRAHRMGATRSVLVETLAMRGTIEEQMLDILRNPIESSRGVKDVQDANDRCKLSQRYMHDPAESSYLAHLEFVYTRNE